MTITSMPEKFSTRVAAAAAAASDSWENQSQRVDRTQSRNDGFFYFMDLPSGKYDLQVTGSRVESKTMKKLTVKQDSKGNITRAIVDLQVSKSM